MSELIEVKNKEEHYFVDADGKLQGEFTGWYNNGEISERCSYLDNQLHGEYRAWIGTDQIWKHCFYINGKLCGAYRNWYTTGKIREHSFYKDSELHGECKRWFMDNEISSHNFYSAGQNISDKIKILVRDVRHITKEEHILIKLKYGISCLPD